MNLLRKSALQLAGLVGLMLLLDVSFTLFWIQPRITHKVQSLQFKEIFSVVTVVANDYLPMGRWDALENVFIDLQKTNPNIQRIYLQDDQHRPFITSDREHGFEHVAHKAASLKQQVPMRDGSTVFLVVDLITPAQNVEGFIFQSGIYSKFFAINVLLIGGILLIFWRFTRPLHRMQKIVQGFRKDPETPFPYEGFKEAEFKDIYECLTELRQAITTERADAQTQIREAQIQSNIVLNSAIHDIKNIAQAIGNINDALIGNDVQANPLLLEMNAATKEMNLITSNLLDSAIREHTQWKAIPEPFDLLPTILQILRMYRATAAKKNLQLLLEVGTLPDFFYEQLLDTRVPVVSDLSLISLIVRNLIDNSIKYSDVDDGDIRVLVSLKQAGARYNLLIEVLDHGKGMPEKTMGLIKDWKRGPSENVKGYGKGLSSVHNSLRALNGYGDLQSNIGRGTSFSITIPVTLPENLGGTKPGIQQQSVPFPDATLSLLFVDDSDYVLNSWRSIAKIAPPQYQWHFATNSTEALVILSAEKIDLAYVDVRLPGKMGDNLVREYKLAGGEAACLLLSAEPISQQECADSFAVNFLSKPMTIEKFQRHLSLYVQLGKEINMYQAEHWRVKHQASVHSLLLELRAGLLEYSQSLSPSKLKQLISLATQISATKLRGQLENLLSDDAPLAETLAGAQQSLETLASLCDRFYLQDPGIDRASLVDANNVGRRKDD